MHEKTNNLAVSDLKFNIGFLELIRVGFELDGRQGMGCWVGLKAGVEKGVHQGALAHPCLTCRISFKYIGGVTTTEI